MDCFTSFAMTEIVARNEWMMINDKVPPRGESVLARVTRCLAAALADTGFALGGGVKAREQGLVEYGGCAPARALGYAGFAFDFHGAAVGLATQWA